MLGATAVAGDVDVPELPTIDAAMRVASAGGAGAMLIPFEASSLPLQATRRAAMRTAGIGRRLGKCGSLQGHSMLGGAGAAGQTNLEQ